MKKIIISLLSIILLFSVFSVSSANITPAGQVNSGKPGDCNPKTSFVIGSDGIDTKTLCYIVLEPNAFPGVKNPNESLSVYLGTVFSFGISIAVVLALIMIIWGGITYMTTDAWSQKEEGKSKIINALWGLGMAFISWILLYTINPNLVSFNNNAFLKGSKIDQSILNKNTQDDEAILAAAKEAAAKNVDCIKSMPDAPKHQYFSINTDVPIEFQFRNNERKWYDRSGIRGFVTTETLVKSYLKDKGNATNDEIIDSKLDEIAKWDEDIKDWQEIDGGKCKNTPY